MRCFLIFTFLAVFIDSIYAKTFCSIRSKRHARKDERYLWPKGIVVYTIEDTVSEKGRKIIKQAMKDISAVSCVRFRKRTNEAGYVRFFNEEGCWADTGYRGYPQRLSLGQGCYGMSTVLHEIFHTLGFHHEHVRPDRDNYVVIHDDNIDPEELHNFNKKSFSDVTTLGLPYDFKSIMHYHDKSFAVNRKKKTLKSVFNDDDINDAVEMSPLDILKLNLLYKCL